MWIAVTLIIGVSAALHFGKYRSYVLWCAVMAQCVNACLLLNHELTVAESRRWSERACVLLLLGFVRVMVCLRARIEQERIQGKAVRDTCMQRLEQVARQVQISGRVEAHTREQFAETSAKWSCLLHRPNVHSTLFVQAVVMSQIVVGIVVGMIVWLSA